MKRLGLCCVMTVAVAAAMADDTPRTNTVAGTSNLRVADDFYQPERLPAYADNSTLSEDTPNSNNNNNSLSGSLKNNQIDNQTVGRNAHPITQNGGLERSVTHPTVVAESDNKQVSGNLKDSPNTNNNSFSGNLKDSPNTNNNSLSGSLKDNQEYSGSLRGGENQSSSASQNNQDNSNNRNNPNNRPRRVPKDNYQLELTVMGADFQVVGGNAFGSKPLSNDELAALLKEHLSIYARQKTPNLDLDQMAFLMQETAAEVDQILRTEGYFNSQTEIIEDGNLYKIQVNKGKRTVIDNVVLQLNGAVEEDSELPVFYRNMMSEWQLPVGSVFRQANWGDSKTAVLNTVQRRKYPLAKIVKSHAQIDKEKNTAELTVAINSGEIVRFGEITIDGVERYPEHIPRNLAPFSYGAIYDFDKLADYQENLEQDGHYGTVAAYADLDNVSEDNIVPVRVTLVEVPRQKVDIGLQYDTLDGVGARLGYTHYNVFKRGYIGSAVLSANRYEQGLSLGLAEPRDAKGHFYTTNVNVKNKLLKGVEYKTLSSGVWHARVRHNIDSRLGVEYYLEDAKYEHGEKIGTSYATLLTASWKSNRIKTKERPANGWYFSGKVGSTLGSALSTANIQRITADAAYYYTPEQKKYGTFIVKGGVGFVHTDNQAKVPSELLFRIGGIDTVRGYEHESIGIPGENDTVLGGTTMANWGLEYQYPISRNFSLALFHDAGDVKNRFQDLKFKHATGTGVRWFSPFAPLSFDIAYAHDTRDIAWYVTLGTRF